MNFSIKINKIRIYIEDRFDTFLILKYTSRFEVVYFYLPQPYPYNNFLNKYTLYNILFVDHPVRDYR